MSIRHKNQYHKINWQPAPPKPEACDPLEYSRSGRYNDARQHVDGKCFPLKPSQYPLSSAYRYKDPIFPNYLQYYNEYWPRTNGQLGEHYFAGYPQYPKMN